MIDITKLIEPAVDWSGQTWAQRLDAAASLLFVHGYINQSTRTKITQKIERQFAEGLKSGAIIERPAPTDKGPHQP